MQPVQPGALTCKQVLRALWRGGKKKESLQLRLWNLNICIEKVDAQCWSAEMTLVMTSLPLARVSRQCLFTFVLVSASRWLAENWQLSRRETTGKLEVEFKFQRLIVASSSSFSHSATRAPGELARKLPEPLIRRKALCVTDPNRVIGPWNNFSGDCSNRRRTWILPRQPARISPANTHYPKKQISTYFSTP